MNPTWPNSCDIGSGRVRFQGSKNIPYEIQELNTLVTSKVLEFLKEKNCVKDTVESRGAPQVGMYP